MRTFNTACFTIAIVCIALGVLLGLAMVWIPMPDDVPFKAFVSLAIIGGGSSLAAGATKILAKGE